VLKDRHHNRTGQLDRQAAFQLPTGPALVKSVFYIHNGFRMALKGGLGLGAIVTGQDVFPLLCGFLWGREANTGKVFLLEPTPGTFISYAFAQAVHPL